MKPILLKSIGKFLNLVSLFSPKLSGKMAIKLFSTPQKGKLKNQEPTLIKESKKRIIKYDTISIMTYQWEGENDTVLLAHGWESNSYRWKHLITFLKDLNYNVIALDAPAHGNSSGQVFNALLFSECIHVVAKTYQPKTIIGHSVGGMASVFCQYKYQLPCVKKMILLGAPSNFVGVFDRYSKMMQYNTVVINAMNNYVLEKFNHLPEYFSAAKFSEEIHSKGLIIHDKEDSIIPYSDALDYKKHFSNAKLISTTGLGHGLKSEKIYNSILEFLNA